MSFFFGAFYTPLRLLRLSDTKAPTWNFPWSILSLVLNLFSTKIGGINMTHRLVVLFCLHILNTPVHLENVHNGYPGTSFQRMLPLKNRKPQKILENHARVFGRPTPLLRQADCGQTWCVLTSVLFIVYTLTCLFTQSSLWMINLLRRQPRTPPHPERKWYSGRGCGLPFMLWEALSLPIWLHAFYLPWTDHLLYTCNLTM